MLIQAKFNIVNFIYNERKCTFSSQKNKTVLPAHRLSSSHPLWQSCHAQSYSSQRKVFSPKPKEVVQGKRKPRNSVHEFIRHRHREQQLPKNKEEQGVEHSFAVV